MTIATTIMLEAMYTRELDAIKNQIEREKSIMKGCHEPNNLKMHQQYIRDLRDYQYALEDLLIKTKKEKAKYVSAD